MELVMESVRQSVFRLVSQSLRPVAVESLYDYVQNVSRIQ